MFGVGRDEDCTVFEVFESSSDSAQPDRRDSSYTSSLPSSAPLPLTMDSAGPGQPSDVMLTDGTAQEYKASDVKLNQQ